MTRPSSTWIGMVVVAAAVVFLEGCLKPTISFVPTTFSHRRSLAIPDTYPVGSVVRAHYDAMETNGEAADFILHRHEFVDATAELTPNGKDHVLEIAARMRSAPFPVMVERSENNSDPELDQFRRTLIAQVLTDLGNPDAYQRTLVGPSYGRGLTSFEAERDYYQFILSRGNYGNQNNGGRSGGYGFGGSSGSGSFGF